jgi:hypothetical protein
MFFKNKIKKCGISIIDEYIRKNKLKKCIIHTNNENVFKTVLLHVKKNKYSYRLKFNPLTNLGKWLFEKDTSTYKTTDFFLTQYRCVNPSPSTVIEDPTNPSIQRLIHHLINKGEKPSLIIANVTSNYINLSIKDDYIHLSELIYQTNPEKELLEKY